MSIDELEEEEELSPAFLEGERGSLTFATVLTTAAYTGYRMVRNGESPAEAYYNSRDILLENLDKVRNQIPDEYRPE